MPKLNFHALVSTFQRSTQERESVVKNKVDEIQKRSNGIRPSVGQDYISEWYEDIGIGYVVYHGQKLAFKSTSISGGKPKVGLHVKELTSTRGFATKIILA